MLRDHYEVVGLDHGVDDESAPALSLTTCTMATVDDQGSFQETVLRVSTCTSTFNRVGRLLRVDHAVSSLRGRVLELVVDPFQDASNQG